MAYFTAPEWLPDGRTLAVLGHRFTAAAGTRSDIWLFAADGSDAGSDGGRNLSAVHDLMAAAGVACDLAPFVYRVVGMGPGRAVVEGGQSALTLSCAAAFPARLAGSCE